MSGAGEVTGNGEIVNHGIIAPKPGKRITVSSDLSLQPTSQLQLEIESGTSVASIEYLGALDVAGTLQVSYGPDFDGEFGPDPVTLELLVADEFRFGFDDVILPPPGPFTASLATQFEPTNDGREALVLTASSGELHVAPECVDMGDSALGAAAASEVIIVENQGLASVGIDALGFVGPDSADFSVWEGKAPNCNGAELTNGESCEIVVQFAASEGGVKRTVLEIGTSLPTDPARVEITATADVVFIDNFEGPLCPE
jgi:hypothetical protein